MTRSQSVNVREHLKSKETIRLVLTLSTRVYTAQSFNYGWLSTDNKLAHHFKEIDNCRRLGGAEAIPNIQYEVLAKPDAPSAHLLGIASAPPNLHIKRSETMY